MRLYIDTEFNGFGGQLMSMAAVSDDGREWYEVLPLPDKVNPWVAEHVVPLLDKEPIGEWEFRASLHRFLKQFDRPIIVADWYTDLAHFFACFAGRNHSETFQYECSAELRLIDNIISVRPHNALSDARAIRNHPEMRNAA